MSIDKTFTSRRNLIKGATFTLLAATTLRMPISDAKEILSENDPMAVALKYRADASLLKAGEIDGFEPTQNCANCLQFKGGENEALGECGLFAGKSVAAKGWCSVWAKG